jgi:hypothetical protein
MQCGVPPHATCLEQPSSSHCLPMALLQAHTPVVLTKPYSAAARRHPPPLSPQRSSVRWTPHARQCESRSDVGVRMSRPRWSTALGRGTYVGRIVVEDGQGLLRTLHRQVRRLLARRAASPNPDGRFEHTPLHTVHGVHSTTEGHLGVYCCSEGAGVRESCPSCVANAVQIHRLVSSAGGSRSSAREPPNTAIPTDAARGLSQ